MRYALVWHEHRPLQSARCSLPSEVEGIGFRVLISALNLRSPIPLDALLGNGAERAWAESQALKLAVKSPGLGRKSFAPCQTRVVSAGLAQRFDRGDAVFAQVECDQQFSGALIGAHRTRRRPK